MNGSKLKNIAGVLLILQIVGCSGKVNIHQLNVSDQCKTSNKRTAKLVEVIENDDGMYQEGAPIENATILSQWSGYYVYNNLLVCMTGHCSHSECLSKSITKTDKNGEFEIECIDKNTSYRPRNKSWPTEFDSITNQLIIMKKGYPIVKYNIHKKDISYHFIPNNYYQIGRINSFYGQPIKIDKYYLLKDEYFSEDEKRTTDSERIFLSYTKDRCR